MKLFVLSLIDEYVWKKEGMIRCTVLANDELEARSIASNNYYYDGANDDDFDIWISTETCIAEQIALDKPLLVSYGE